MRRFAQEEKVAQDSEEGQAEAKDKQIFTGDVARDSGLSEDGATCAGGWSLF